MHQPWEFCLLPSRVPAPGPVNQPDERGAEARVDTWQVATIGRLASTARVIARAPTIVVASLFVLASLAKSGLVVWNWFELSPFLLTDWAGPASAFQANVLLNAVATAWHGLGLDPTSFLWQLSQVGVTVLVFLVLCALVLRRTDPDARWLALALILSSGIAAVLWREVGRYDAYFVLGVALALLAASSWMSWIGVGVAALASPEQALSAGILLLLLSCLPMFRSWRNAAWRLAGAGLLVVAAVQMWFELLGNPGKTRIGVLLDHFTGQPIAAASAYDTSQGFFQFTLEKAMVSLSAGPGLIWSVFGSVMLLMVLVLLIQGSWWQGLALLAIVIVIPIVAGFTFGEDRTRDIALIVSPVIIALVLTGCGHLLVLMRKLPGEVQTWTTWIALLVILIPSTYFYLSAEEPWRWTKELLISINNGVPMVNDGSLR